MVKRSLFIFLILVIGVSACISIEKVDPKKGTHPITSTTKIRLPMGYIPSVQFAPFYVALDKGYYKDESLDIEFDYSFETDAVTLVGHQDLPFAVVSGEQVLLARAQGLPVVYVMTYYKDYPVVLVSKSDKQISKPNDLIGKRVGVPMLSGASYIGLRAMLSATGIKENQISLETIGYNQVESLALDKQEVVVCYINNEPVQMESQGYKVNSLRVSDYVLLVSTGLITNELTLMKNPDLVRRMVKATLRGIRSTIEDPKEAFEISKKYVDNLANANPQQEKDQKEILKVTLDLWRSDPMGKTNPKAWENMQDVLLDMGMLMKKLDVGKAYSNEFLK